MKIVRTVILETGPDGDRVQGKISTSGWAEETRFIDRDRILAKIVDQSNSGLRQKERNIRNIEGVMGCTILTTQYMP
jgi:hypothetical protein